MVNKAFAAQIADAITRDSYKEARDLLRVALESGLLSELETIKHPLGFFQLKFGSQEFGHVKLHTWLPGRAVAQNPPWFVHRHRWPLTSMVLAGSITNETFQVELDAEAERALYDVQFVDGESILVRTKERVRMERASSVEISIGSTYVVADSEYHQSVVSDQAPTVTIVVSSPATRLCPSVIGMANGLQRYRYRRDELTEADRSNILDALSESLSS